MEIPEVEAELDDFSVVEESGESSVVGASSLESFDVQRQVENSWFHLSNGNSIELPWEQGYWKSFFSNEYQGTDILSGVFKRPVPVPNVERCGVVEPEPKRVKPSLKVAESWEVGLASTSSAGYEDIAAPENSYASPHGSRSSEDLCLW